METIYLILIIVLFILAISDLVVGVSNDAVNFLNSAVGAKAASFRTIMIVAAIGIVVGATFSSGMMEVARKGIFYPQHFYFSEIIILFLAVMVTDVILLDLFNTFGMPTSTTVSIVFELLGAAVAISILKTIYDPNALALAEYINSGKALAIISGILLSVVVAFSAGMIVQFLSRALFSFDYAKRIKYYGAIWGGLAIAAITYFILIKGSKGASFMTDTTKDFIADNTYLILFGSFLLWTVLLQVLSMITKLDILKFVVLVGTFALAMAFAGNDLVNFIGVPLAGYESFKAFVAQDALGPDAMLMGGLAGKVKTPTLFLLGAGAIMVVTLWTSKKAQSVVKTSLDLGRQDEGYERFASNTISRSIVRMSTSLAKTLDKILPASLKESLSRQFDETAYVNQQAALPKEDRTAFDMIRASVTLIVASILISIGTNLKLPLSTTYVTFMVAMGTSLADGAWGRESAVYRVSGVLSVIGGWFFTAFSAFTGAFIVAMFFSFTGFYGIPVILIFAGFMMYRTHVLHKERTDMEDTQEDEFSGEMGEGALLRLSEDKVEKSLSDFNTYIEQAIVGLAKEDLKLLRKNVKDYNNVNLKIFKLKNTLKKVMSNFTDNKVLAGYHYALVSDYLYELSKSVKHIVQASYGHIDNNHKPLIDAQVTELKKLNTHLQHLTKLVIGVFRDPDPALVNQFHSDFKLFFDEIKSTRTNQLKRLKKREVGNRNSNLFFELLGSLRNFGLFLQRLVINRVAIFKNEEAE